MKTRISLFILLLTLSKTVAQIPESPNIYGMFYKHNCKTVSSYGIEKKGEYVYIFADSVHLRAGRTVHSKSLTWLHVGQKVKVLDWTQRYDYEVSGHKDSWYKVQTEDGQRGFVFGSLLSKGFLTYDLDKDGQKELIMIGSDFHHPKHSCLRIMQAHNLLTDMRVDSTCLDADCENLPMLRIIKDPKLANQIVIEVSAGSNFCGSYWRSTYFYWTNNQLNHIFSVDVAQYKNDPFLATRFPSDAGGVRNQIVVHKYSEDKNGKIKFTPKQAYAFADSTFKRIR